MKSLMLGLCCCGKKEIAEPLIVNDVRHEPFGGPEAFCGPSYKHKIRDLETEVTALREALLCIYKKAGSLI